MLTARATGQSARFCGEDVKYPQQTQRNAQRLGNLLFPHQPHPLSGGVANRLYVTVPLSRLAGGHFYYTGCTAFCQILLVLLPRARTAFGGGCYTAGPARNAADDALG